MSRRSFTESIRHEGPPPWSQAHEAASRKELNDRRLGMVTIHRILCPVDLSEFSRDAFIKKEELREVHAVGTSEAGRGAVAAREEAYHRYRLLATMVQGTAAALPEAWQSYRNVEEARIG